MTLPAPRLLRPLFALAITGLLAFSVVGQVHAHDEVEHDEPCAACVVVHSIAAVASAAEAPLAPVPCGTIHRRPVDGVSVEPNRRALGRAPPRLLSSI